MKFRKVIIAWVLLAVGYVCHGQQPWSISSLQEAYSDAVFLRPPSEAVMKKVVKAGGRKVQYDCNYRLSGPYSKWGRGYLRLQNDSIDAMIPVQTAELLLPQMISHRYWDKRF